jgi:hypothetical protein
LEIFSRKCPGAHYFKDRVVKDGGPVIVAVRKGSFDISYYDWVEVYFQFWKKFTGDVSVSELRECIETAGSKKAMEAIYPRSSE